MVSEEVKAAHEARVSYDRVKLAFVDKARGVLDDVQYRDWKFLVGLTAEDVAPFLQVRFVAPDTSDGSVVTSWSGRKWLLSVYMTKSEIVGTALKAVLTAVEHEAREEFRYRGRMIYGPHIAVDALAEACLYQDARE